MHQQTLENKIYAVYGDNGSSRYLLGYATGLTKDIAAFFDDKKGYGLLIEEVQPIHIPSGYKLKLETLKLQKKALELELEEINKQIKNP